MFYQVSSRNRTSAERLTHMFVKTRMPQPQFHTPTTILNWYRGVAVTKTQQRRTKYSDAASFLRTMVLV